MMRTIAHYVSDYSILERIVPFLVRERREERGRGRERERESERERERGREIEKRGRERGRDRERQREEKRKRGGGRRKRVGERAICFNFCFHFLSPLLYLFSSFSSTS